MISFVFSEFIVQEESIVNAGPLGVIGAIGWFLPTHILSNDTLAPLNLYECTEPAFFEYWRSLESPGKTYRNYAKDDVSAVRCLSATKTNICLVN